VEPPEFVDALLLGPLGHLLADGREQVGEPVVVVPPGDVVADVAEFVAVLVGVRDAPKGVSRPSLEEPDEFAPSPSAMTTVNLAGFE
jgi:hypothetical protein